MYNKKTYRRISRQDLLNLPITIIQRMHEFLLFSCALQQIKKQLQNLPQSYTKLATKEQWAV